MGHLLGQSGLSWVMWSVISLGLMTLGNMFARMAGLAGQSAFGIVVVIFFVNLFLASTILITQKPDVLAHPQGVVWSVLAGLGTGSALICLMIAYTTPGSQTGVATAIMNSNFALVALLSFIFLKEVLTFKQVIGLVVILLGMGLLV